MSKKTLLITVTVAALLSVPAFADLQAGRAALERGDYAGALEELRPLARSDKEAAFHLATMYRNGWGTQESWASAAQWYKAAADRGHAQAQFEYAAALEFGRGVVRNRKEAYDWYLKAAQQDHLPSMTQVGRYHLYGIHRAANFLEARRWLNKAAEAGDAEAQVLIDEILRKNALIIDIPGTANPTEEAAQRVLNEVKDLVGPLLADDVVSRVKLGGAPTVMNADGGHVVVLPLVEIVTIDGATIRFGNVKIAFSPDGDDYSVTVKLPARAGLVARDKTVIGNVNFGRSEIVGRWSTDLHMLTDYRAELSDIRVTSAKNSTTMTVGGISGGRTFTPLSPGHFDVVERIRTRDVQFDHAVNDTAQTIKLASFDYVLQYLDMDVEAVSRVADRFGVDWRTGVTRRRIDLDELPTVFPPMLRDMLITVQARDLSVTQAGGKRLGGLRQLEFSLGGANLEEALSALTLTYAHDDLTVDGPGAGEAPREMRVNLTASRMPLSQMAGISMTSLRDGIRLGQQRADRLARSGNYRAAVRASMATPLMMLTTQGADALNAALKSAGSELRINEVSVQADDYQFAIAGRIRPSQAGITGTLDIRIAGKDELAKAMRDGQVDIDGINPMDLLPSHGLAVREQSEDGRVMDLYRFAFLPDGAITINGRPMGSEAKNRR